MTTNTTAPRPLRIAILGCGKIGSAFAFRLARAGHTLTVIARPGSSRFEQLRREGAIVDDNGERANVAVTDTLDEQTPYELIVITLLAHQIAATMPALQRCRAGIILFMFNTFDPDSLCDAVGAGRAAFGMPFIQAQLDGEGRVKAIIGAAGRKTLLGDQQWVDLFDGAGLPAALEPDMPLWLRSHAPLCVAFESVSVAAMRRGSGASWREALMLARGVHAAFGLLKALGYALHPSKRGLDRTPTWGVAAML